MRRQSWPLILLVMVLVATAGTLLLGACASEQPPPTSGITYGTLTPAQLASMLEKKDFTFINVHIPYEGEIDKTDAFIPYNEIAKHIGQLPADKGAKIVLYCRSGAMSADAAEQLIKRGYTNVSHLGGGMVAWQKAGNEILDRKR